MVAPVTDPGKLRFMQKKCCDAPSGSLLSSIIMTNPAQSHGATEMAGFCAAFQWF
ncbi:hypothetical protein [Stenotrophomonas sp. Marseille-Q4652]|uniref:hypothetical protein n=1 Tax=Stenotrophomonas sp. Marseille-Q4652 TaxID=2866595 RepID=UPI001CE41ACE|nr:hypothetical protein [Stenotrophomonas sp. Marseille-Q4652]